MSKIKLKTTPYMSIQVPREWYLDDNEYEKLGKEFSKYKEYKFWEIIDRELLAAKECASVGVVVSGLAKSSPIPPLDPQLTWSLFQVVSPLSGAVVNVTNSGLSITGDGCLYIENEHPMVSDSSTSLILGSASNARKPGNIPLGVVSGGSVFLTSNVVKV